jgi:hypothetical protein
MFDPVLQIVDYTVHKTNFFLLHVQYMLPLCCKVFTTGSALDVVPSHLFLGSQTFLFPNLHNKYN